MKINVDDEIKEYELENPELRLITTDHKILFFDTISLSECNDPKILKEKLDKVLDKISQDINFTGERLILVGVMNIHMIHGISELINREII